MEDSDLKNKKILIVGGTGTLGYNLCSVLLKYDINQIMIFSRDEFKQHNMKNHFKNHPKLKFIIGDCRDYESVRYALRDVNIVIHAAALKHVPIIENNPFEAIKTNIYGSENVVKACVENKVEKLIGVSTDKCVDPVNLYGATKLCLEKIVLYANILSNHHTKACVVRYGNVFGSRGSVVPLFLQQKEKGVLTITDERMTRFTITINEAVNLVLNAITHTIGGEIFIPRIPSYKINQLAKLIAPECEIKYVGIRPGEKLHECMISRNESHKAIDCEKFFVIFPDNDDYKKENFVSKYFPGKLVEGEFEYNSKDNEYITDDGLRQIINSYNE